MSGTTGWWATRPCRPDQRHTFLLAPTVNRDAPLLPAGLLGPVTIQTMQVVRLKSLDPVKTHQTN